MQRMKSTEDGEHLNWFILHFASGACAFNWFMVFPGEDKRSSWRQALGAQRDSGSDWIISAVLDRLLIQTQRRQPEPLRRRSSLPAVCLRKEEVWQHFRFIMPWAGTFPSAIIKGAQQQAKVSNGSKSVRSEPEDGDKAGETPSLHPPPSSPSPSSLSSSSPLLPADPHPPAVRRSGALPVPQWDKPGGNSAQEAPEALPSAPDHHGLRWLLQLLPGRALPEAALRGGQGSLPLSLEMAVRVYAEQNWVFTAR